MTIDTITKTVDKNLTYANLNATTLIATGVVVSKMRDTIGRSVGGKSGGMSHGRIFGSTTVNNISTLVNKGNGNSGRCAGLKGRAMGHTMGTRTDGKFETNVGRMGGTTGCCFGDRTGCCGGCFGKL